ncbi:MAG: serine--tRNA ligase [Candidatus Lokiarchaeota archaeon]|nr:serine--tRNA ligase [Candidatus Lokiarchaeota archaeon]
MLDIKLFREQADLVRESERKRFRNVENVNTVICLDIEWRESLQRIQELRQKRNSLTKEISKCYKQLQKLASEDEKKKLEEKAEQLKLDSKKIGNAITEEEPKTKELLQQRDEYRYRVGNILDNKVPIADDETGNLIIRKYGRKKNFPFDIRNHVDLMELIGGVNTKKASEIAGNRFYYLQNELVKLNIALINFALDHLISEGYSPMWTPFFVRHEVIKEAAELADFEEQLYKIQDEDLYLIATSEQTLAALHRNEIIDEKLLPIKYAGVSSCFRRETGSHGKDTLGIFRVHQFEKVEQYVYCKPEDSPQLHEEMIGITEKIFKDLRIPYRIVNIASGELNDNASIKYDLEAWFPASQAYRELVSATNCRDYQARKLNARFGTLGDPDTYEVVHTLNATAIATERFMCCLVENHQQEDGSIIIPKALKPYMGGIDLIPARNNA